MRKRASIVCLCLTIASNFLSTEAGARLLATTLAGTSGIVLIAGGGTLPFPTLLRNVELFDPAANRFSDGAGAMTLARTGHIATRLDNGKVLLAGGESDPGGLDCGATNSTELYDPAARTFATKPPTMNDGRTGAVSVRLSNGKVLIAGGVGCRALASTELYDPATNSFAPPQETATMNFARAGLSASVISAGPNTERVLLAGGITDVSPRALSLTATELYDPGTNSFAPPWQTAQMNEFRLEAVSVELGNGKILIAGGGFSALGWDSSTELYDQATNSFAPPSTTPLMNSPRVGAVAVRLTIGPNRGKVLIVGGSEMLGTPPLASTELYDPITNTFSPLSTTPRMNIARRNLVATVLDSGKVLVYGSPDGAGDPVVSTELYDPMTNSFSFGPKLDAERAGASLTLLK
jgi:hypothetical protein